MPPSRGLFSSRIGFILAAAGSAVGLGNIWKFPYITGANGGGAFLVIYLVITFSIGLSVMLAELAIGRAAEKSPVGAFAKLRGGAWPIVGIMGVAAGFIILSFYGVVAGWTLAYIGKVLTGLLTLSDPAAFGGAFGAFIADPVQPVLYSALFMALTVGVVIGGVAPGIERACKILMPALILIIVVLMVRTLTLPGAEKGLAFYLSPDFSKVTAATFHAALAHAFFSLSLGMGAMITYGSYMHRRESLANAAMWVTTLDAGIAVIAGLVILPAVFAFGFDPAQGPGLTFVTLPAVFAQMPAGMFFGLLFFVLLAVAALTSSVSLLEVVVAYFIDERNMSRKRAATMFGAIIFLLGIPSSLSLGVWKGYTIQGKGFFDVMDYIATNLLLPMGGICIALFVGWVILPRAITEATGNGATRPGWVALWSLTLKFLAPAAIAWILISGLSS